MITALHLSEKYNRYRILKNGLFPSEVKLDHHLDAFREKNYLEESENKILYMWLNSERNEKFIKDMVYCKVWIQPRNNLCIGEEYIDFSLIDKNILYPYTNMIYDIYEVSTPSYVNLGLLDNHVQEPSDSKYSTVYQMDDEYAHNDKVLVLSKKVETNIKIIGQVKLDIYKNKINIKMVSE